MLRFFLLTAFLFLCLYTNAQQRSLSSTYITISWKDVPLAKALEEVSQKSEYNFIYSRSFLPNKKLTLSFEQISLNNLLNKVFSNTNLTYKQSDNEILISKKKEDVDPFLALNGTIKDHETGEGLISAIVFYKQISTSEDVTTKGVSTNIDGFFATNLKKGTYQIDVKYLGYRPYKKEIEINHPTSLAIRLEPMQLELNEVLVEGISESERQLDYLVNKVGLLELKTETIENTPAFLGEEDVVRSLQLLPSVQTIPEGSAGLFVRGGTEGQNLVMLDGAPIYNPSHMFGLFSIFNTDAVKKVDLYNEAFPARFGGRIASVVDVQMKDGNMNKKQAAGSIGSISSHLTAESPWAKGKGTFWIGGRFTYIDLLMRLFSFRLPTADRFYFYDVNMKATWSDPKAGKFSFTSYFGNDNSGLGNVTNYTWGNQTYSLRWSKVMGKRWFNKTTLYHSNFENRSEISVVESQGYRQAYNLWDTGLRQQFNYYHNNKLSLETGGELIHHKYNFGSLEPLDSISVVRPEGLDPSYVIKSAGFFEIDYRPFSKINTRIGLRYSRFDHIGPGSRKLYDVEKVVSPITTANNIVGTETFENKKVFDSQFGWEPRFSVSYLFTPNSSLKFTYTRMIQYLHLLSNQGTIPPLTYWIPSDRYIPAQYSDLFSVGFFKRKLSGKYKLSLQGYYRVTRNQIDFKPSANLFLNDHVETEVLLGRNKTYGAELLFVKEKGDLTGTFSYTYASSIQTIDGVNQGEPYPSSSDRRHNISFLATQKLTPRMNLSANWMFSSGVAFSFPAGRYEKDGIILPYYASRNGFRLPATHRLDLSLSLKQKPKEDSDATGEFNISIYNFYGRKNPYSYVFRQSSVAPSKTEVVKLFLFTVLPAVSYKFSF